LILLETFLYQIQNLTKTKSKHMFVLRFETYRFRYFSVIKLLLNFSLLLRFHQKFDFFYKTKTQLKSLKFKTFQILNQNSNSNHNQLLYQNISKF
jgi:hypothetical protein